MQVWLVRHGEADYSVVNARGVRGWATSFAPLSAVGRLQMGAISADYRLQDSDLILCSSYARALESAALLSRKLDRPLHVEYDLHEWLPQKDPLGEVDATLVHRASEGFGQPNAPWEQPHEVLARVEAVLARYAHHASITVVTHAVVIQTLLGIRRPIDHAEILPFTFDAPSRLQQPPVPGRNSVAHAR